MSDFLFIESIVIQGNTVLTDCFLCDSETDEVKYMDVRIQADKPFCCKMSDFLFIESIVIQGNTVLTDCFLCDSETDEVKYIK